MGGLKDRMCRAGNRRPKGDVIVLCVRDTPELVPLAAVFLSSWVPVVYLRRSEHVHRRQIPKESSWIGVGHYQNWGLQLCSPGADGLSQSFQILLPPLGRSKILSAVKQHIDRVFVGRKDTAGVENRLDELVEWCERAMEF